MGRFLPLAGVNPPADRLKVDVIDPVLPPVGGALLLVEPGHPFEPWVGVPGTPGVTGTPVPNLAAKQASAMLSIPESSARVNLIRSAGVDDSSKKAKTERTAKGGFHTLFSPTLNNTSSDRTMVMLGGPDTSQWGNTFLRDYLFANSLQKYLSGRLFVSMWVRITRGAKSGTVDGVVYHATDIMTLASTTSTTGRYRHRFGVGNQPNPSAAAGMSAGYESYAAGNNDMVDVSGNGGPATSGAGLKRFVNAGKGYYGSPAPASLGEVFATPFYIGNWGTVNTYLTAVGGSASAILYRVYMEDLDVSGRTAAQVDALDRAEYIKAFSAGGRYFGDTWSDPSTIP